MTSRLASACLGLILPLLTALPLLAPADARAWGHVRYLREQAASAYLIFPALRGETLLYCLESGDARFDRESLSLQVETALGQWLAPVASATGKAPVIQAVDCSDPRHQLRIDLSPEREHPKFGAYFVTEKGADGRHRGRIQLDSEFTTLALFTKVRIRDFREYALPGKTLAETLGELSAAPHSLEAYNRRSSANYHELYWSTYRVLFHELGHAIGLCDTYAGGIEHCDSEYRSRKHPDSLMKHSNFLYPTDDDRQGVEQLITRFRR